MNLKILNQNGKIYNMNQAIQILENVVILLLHSMIKYIHLEDVSCLIRKEWSVNALTKLHVSTLSTKPIQLLKLRVLTFFPEKIIMPLFLENQCWYMVASLKMEPIQTSYLTLTWNITTGVL